MSVFAAHSLSDSINFGGKYQKYVIFYNLMSFKYDKFRHSCLVQTSPTLG